MPGGAAELESTLREEEEEEEGKKGPPAATKMRSGGTHRNCCALKSESRQGSGSPCVEQIGLIISQLRVSGKVASDSAPTPHIRCDLVPEHFPPTEISPFKWTTGVLGNHTVCDWICRQTLREQISSVLFVWID